MLAEKSIQAPTQERLKMSYDDYLALANESQIVEWVEGEVIIHMPPAVLHQQIGGFLMTLLDGFVQYFGKGIVLPAPLEVKLWPDGPSREPDILFVAQENLARLTPRRFEGPPDLVIEIISPGSVTEDRVRKFMEYEQAGVPEYWLIDPRPHQEQVDFYGLDEAGTYQTLPVDEAGIYHSTVLPNFWLDLAWFHQDPLPNPQFVLAEIMLQLETLPADARAAYQAMYDLLKPEV